MLRHTILLISSFAIALASTTSALAETTYRALVLDGADDIRATLLNVNHDQYYLEVQGTGTPLDGLVVATDEGALDWNSRAFTIDYHGLHYPILREYDGKYALHRLYVGEPVDLTANALASEDIDGRAMLERHEAQKQDGTLAALRGFDRDERIKLVEHSLGLEDNVRKATCGTYVSVSVDWSTFEDRHFSEEPSPSWCSAAIESLRALCDKDGPFASIVLPQENIATINAIECRIGPTNTFRIHDGTLLFEFNENLFNAEYQGKYVLYNALQ